MNLRQVEIFLSILEHGSFSAAARGLHLTQSTISQHIAALEEEVGVQLLERSRNGVRLTDGGKILLKHARRLVGELRATESAFSRFRGLEETTLRIGVSTIPGAYLVPQVLTRLCETFPRLEVVVRQGDSRDTIELLAARDVEVGVVGSRFEEKGLQFAESGRDQICLVVHPGHPWASRAWIPPAELLDGVFLTRESGSGTGRTVDAALREAGIDSARLRVRAEIGSGEAIKAAVMAGLGMAFLSDLAIRREAERGDLVVVPVQGVRITRPFFLVRQTGRDLAPASAAFWELMQAIHTPGAGA